MEPLNNRHIGDFPILSIQAYQKLVHWKCSLQRTRPSSDLGNERLRYCSAATSPPVQSADSSRGDREQNRTVSSQSAVNLPQQLLPLLVLASIYILTVYPVLMVAVVGAVVVMALAAVVVVAVVAAVAVAVAVTLAAAVVVVAVVGAVVVMAVAVAAAAAAMVVAVVVGSQVPSCVYEGNGPVC